MRFLLFRLPRLRFNEQESNGIVRLVVIAVGLKVAGQIASPLASADAWLGPAHGPRAYGARRSSPSQLEQAELGVVVGAVGQAGAVLVEVLVGVLLELGEFLVGLGDDGGGESGHAGDMDAVAALRGAGFDAVEELDGVVGFADADADVLEGGGVSQLEDIEFVVVGGEEAAAAGGVEQVGDDGPGDGDAVGGAGAASDFIQEDEAVWGGVVEDVCGFGHFDHEGGLAFGEVVDGADAGEDGVDQADFGLGGWDEAADLGHEDAEGDLAHVGGFAGHVGAGNELQLWGGLVLQVVEWGEAAAQVAGVGDVLAHGEFLFEDGVAGFDQVEGGGGVEEGAGVLVLGGDGG